uniref:beta-N-acetylhexosaminidase n=1 Tax=Stylophora pistillata TaxID=50429 RepID=A0A2B4RC34_STYPI
MPKHIITIEPTNNPAILKFVGNQLLVKGNAYQYNNVDEAKEAPLPKQLFHLPFVSKVFVSTNFIAIEKFDIVEWEAVQEDVRALIEAYLNQGNEVVTTAATPQKIVAEVYAESTPNPSVLKFAANRMLSQKAVEFKKVQDASYAPLVVEIFKLGFVAEVYLAENYISVTKTEQSEWNPENIQQVRNFIKKYIEAGKLIIDVTKIPTLADATGEATPLEKLEGAYRKSTQVSNGNRWSSKIESGTPHTGFYTQEDIKEIIDYAEKLHINVVPEIEMPGHASAAIAAYPWLGVLNKQIEVPTRFGVVYDVYNVASPKVYKFITEVLDEVMALFPSPVIHIGTFCTPATDADTLQKFYQNVRPWGFWKPVRSPDLSTATTKTKNDISMNFDVPIVTAKISSVFTEDGANNGELTGALLFNLDDNDGAVGNELYVSVNGDNFINAPTTIAGRDPSYRKYNLNTHYTVANVPDGLTLELRRNNATKGNPIVVFTGKATAHAKANSVNNITITLKSAILQNGSDLSAVPSKTKDDIKIDFDIIIIGIRAGKYVDDGYVFKEQQTSIGNGKFTNATPDQSYFMGVQGNDDNTYVNLQFSEETVKPINKGTHFTVGGLPNGLNLKFERTKKGKNIRFWFTGAAVNHANSDDTTFTITFDKSIFANRPTSNDEIIGRVQTFKIDFVD